MNTHAYLLNALLASEGDQDEEEPPAVDRCEFCGHLVREYDSPAEIYAPGAAMVS